MKTARKPLYALLGDDIAVHLKTMQDGQRATDWYFRTGSKFAKALEDHVLNAKDKDCIIDREGRSIACHRGTGYVVELNEPCLHFAIPEEVQTMSFELKIGYEPKRDDDEYDSDHEIERIYRLHCPIDLELNFNKLKFDLWLIETRKHEQEKRLKNDRKLLDKLLKRNTDYAMDKLLKMKS